MGGQLAVAFRFKDGRIICRKRGTDALPDWFKDSRLYGGAPDHVESYLGMAPDNEDIPVAPLDYGLVVVDYLSNHLLSYQNYTSLGLFSPWILSAELGGDDIDAEERREVRITVGGLLAEGRLFERIYRRAPGNARGALISETMMPPSIDALIASLPPPEGGPVTDRTFFREFRIDTRPLVLIDFMDLKRVRPVKTEAGKLRDFRDKLNEVGIVEDGAAALTWDSWIRESEEERRAEEDAA